MSLILDALNRADNERKNQDAMPGLNTVHPSPAIIVEEKTGNRTVLYIAISLSIIALGLLVYWFIAKPGSASGIAVHNSQLESNKTPIVSSIPVPSATQQPNVESSQVSTAPAASSMVDKKLAESVIAPKPTAAVEQLYTAPEAQSTVADPQVNELYTAEEPATSESITDPFAEPAALAAEPTHITNTGRGGLDLQPSRTFANITEVQDFNELPWNTKQQISTISYQRHNFLAGGVSTVVINGQTLGVGNIASSSQLVVQEIFEDGVVLKRGNVIFKLRALNGWINM